MPACCAYGCRSRSERELKCGITFHLFPKNEEKRKLWTAAVGRKHFTPSKSTVICSLHFRPEDFDRTSHHRVRIKGDAVPSIFEDFPKHLKKVNKSHPKPGKRSSSVHKLAVGVSPLHEQESTLQDLTPVAPPYSSFEIEPIPSTSLNSPSSIIPETHIKSHPQSRKKRAKTVHQLAVGVTSPHEKECLLQDLAYIALLSSSEPISSTSSNSFPLAISDTPLKSSPQPCKSPAQQCAVGVTSSYEQENSLQKLASVALLSSSEPISSTSDSLPTTIPNIHVKSVAQPNKGGGRTVCGLEVGVISPNKQEISLQEFASVALPSLSEPITSISSDSIPETGVKSYSQSIKRDIPVHQLAIGVTSQHEPENSLQELASVALLSSSDPIPSISSDPSTLPDMPAKSHLQYHNKARSFNQLEVGVTSPHEQKSSLQELAYVALLSSSEPIPTTTPKSIPDEPIKLHPHHYNIGSRTVHQLAIGVTSSHEQESSGQELASVAPLPPSTKPITCTSSDSLPSTTPDRPVKSHTQPHKKDKTIHQVGMTLTHKLESSGNELASVALPPSTESSTSAGSLPTIIPETAVKSCTKHHKKITRTGHKVEVGLTSPHEQESLLQDLASVSIPSASESVPSTPLDSFLSSLPDTPLKSALKRKFLEKEHQLSASRKRIKTLLQARRRDKKRNSDLKEIIKILQKQDINRKSIEVFETCSGGLVPSLLKRQKAKLENGSLPSSYSPELIGFALTLHFYSPRAYSYVRKVFDACLPHPRTIRGWRQHMGDNSGATSMVPPVNGEDQVQCEKPEPQCDSLVG